MIPMVQPQGAHQRPPSTGISQRVQPPAHTGPIPRTLETKRHWCVLPGAASKAQRRQNGNLSHPQSKPEPNTPTTQAPRRTNGPAWKIPALRNDLNIGTLGALLQAKKHAIKLDVASSASASQC